MSAANYKQNTAPRLSAAMNRESLRSSLRLTYPAVLSDSLEVVKRVPSKAKSQEYSSKAPLVATCINSTEPADQNEKIKRDALTALC